MQINNNKGKKRRIDKHIQQRQMRISLQPLLSPAIYNTQMHFYSSFVTARAFFDDNFIKNFTFERYDSVMCRYPVLILRLKLFQNIFVLIKRTP